MGVSEGYQSLRFAQACLSGNIPGTRDARASVAADRTGSGRKRKMQYPEKGIASKQKML